MFDQARRLMVVGDFHEAANRLGFLRARLPDQTPIRIVHGLCGAAMGMHELAGPELAVAAAEIKAAMDAAPQEDPHAPRRAEQLLIVLAQLARSQEALGMSSEADRVYEQAIAIDPEDAFTIRARIEILAARARIDDAKALLDRAVEQGLEELPAAMAAGAIALAKPQASPEEFRMLAQRLKAMTERVGLDAVTQGEALRRCAELFHRAGESDEAFRALNRSANLRRGKFDAAVHARITNATLEAWTPDAAARLKRPNPDASQRIFVIGLPGSGADELARAMTADPRVGSVGPCDILTLCAMRHADAKPTPHRPMMIEPAKLRGTQLESMAKAYTEQSGRAAQPGGRPFVVDSSHLHIHLLGLAAAALPQAKFVFVRREPLAGVLACYAAPLHGHHPYGKEIGTVGAYAADFTRLCDHWTNLLTGMGHTVVTVSRDALVTEPAAEMARVMTALGLDANAPAPRFAPSPADEPDRYARRLEPVAELLRAAGPA
jgi:tetratricopeptide (TPR) repeat protein